MYLSLAYFIQPNRKSPVPLDTFNDLILKPLVSFDLLVKLCCVQVSTCFISCVLRSEGNLAYQFSLSTLFETGSLVVHHCVVQAGP